MLSRRAELAIADAGFAGLTLPRIGLFTNQPELGTDPLYAAFVLAAYTGYANDTPTVSDIFVSQPDNKVSVALSEAVFLGPASGDPGIIYGWFLFDNVTHDVWAAEYLPAAPITLTTVLDRLMIDIELKLTGSCVSTVER